MSWAVGVPLPNQAKQLMSRFGKKNPEIFKVKQEARQFTKTQTRPGDTADRGDMETLDRKLDKGHEAQRRQNRRTRKLKKI